MRDQLPGVFGTLAPYLDDYGYAAVAFFVALENVVPFFPGEAAVITAAVFARAGDLNLAVVCLLAFLAAFLGNNVSYALGRFGGRPLVLKVGRRVRITPEHLDRVEGFYARFGPRVVVVARFLPVLRHVSGISAGVAKMPVRSWLINNALGAALWAFVWSAVGYWAGGHLEGVDRALTWGVPLVGLLLAIGVIVHLIRRRRKAATA